MAGGSGSVVPAVGRDIAFFSALLLSFGIFCIVVAVIIFTSPPRDFMSLLRYGAGVATVRLLSTLAAEAG